jgi:methionine-rich copper-binding protein CopC
MNRLLILLSLSLLFFNVALAHSELESTVPTDGALLDHAPTEIVLTFKTDIQPGFSIFKVYAIPADMLAEATAHAEGESQDDHHSEDTSSGHSEEESHDDEHAEGTSSHDDTAAAEHSESESHGSIDTAAKMFIPTVIDLQGDEDARADTGINSTDNLAKSVTINLKDDLAAGAYVVMFRVLSGDTHPIEGYITFEITGH